MCFDHAHFSVTYVHVMYGNRLSSSISVGGEEVGMPSNDSADMDLNLDLAVSAQSSELLIHLLGVVDKWVLGKPGECVPSNGLSSATFSRKNMKELSPEVYAPALPLHTFFCRIFLPFEVGFVYTV